MNTNQKAELEEREWQRTNPQQSSATIQDLHAEVWQFRREMAAYFPTPSQADSIAFAFTEIAEAVDATLRQNPLYKRNQDKAHSVERELAQCAMMLLTAVLPADMEGVEIMYRQPALNWDVDDIAFRVGAILGGDRTVSYILHTVHAIGVIIDLPTHLRAELARMRIKHGPVQDDGPASMNEPANEHSTEPGLTPAEMQFLNERKWTPDTIREAARETALNAHIWQTEEPANYSIKDSGEFVLI